ncbi:hypothetical protein GCM10010398_24910 [Streptomyces fimbriatus]
MVPSPAAGADSAAGAGIARGRPRSFPAPGVPAFVGPGAERGAGPPLPKPPKTAFLHAWQPPFDAGGTF